MLNRKLQAVVAVLAFCSVGAAFADTVDCHEVKNNNRSECVRAKAHINHHDDAVDCGNVQNKNKDECVRAKVNVNHRDDVVDCGNAQDKNKDECVRAKFNHKN